jgi:hypothetical protein
MKSLSILLALTVACGGGSKTTTKPDPATKTDPAPKPADPVAKTDSPKPDLSTADSARTAILEALKRDDKEAFRSMVSKRMLERQKDFDAYYNVWKDGAAKSPDKFKSIKVTQEDGAFKLDEN